MISKSFYRLIKNYFSTSEALAINLNLIANLLVIGILGYIFFKLFRHYGTRFVKKLVSKTSTNFDDFLLNNRVFLNASRIVVFVFLYSLLSAVLVDFPNVLNYGHRFVNLIILFSIIWFVRSILLTIKDFLRTLTAFKDKPLESYVQIFMIVLWIIGFIISFSIVTGKPLIRFLTALGAFSAVLLLIFKDTILGFVASIQITVNDTVRLNDWITIDKYNADGNVTAINLASVIVQNFDNTVTSIPTYSLISESFKNWRAMDNSGGRRIKRSVLIKINSIEFLTDADVAHYKKIALISDYVSEAYSDVQAYNTTNNIDKSILINGRNLTNFGMFRKYLDEYLKQHPKINQELLFMSRQLQPTENGIPLEIYAFCKNKAWHVYERDMADIFDHILASVSYFNLEVFESPTGTDISTLKQ
ncbi:mechanosensitive ion channel [Tenacibaculum finnmarkense]|uniref:mechanosensitive ion channel family protein n=1 Tax=Tenacibaculum finnmarkense TaxID=2781243 RepID=UPI001E3B0FF9|nr:mechanosensitive ion channel domain-containing protein [Tenacibaculum finnmarkense]MCD8401683.1 mechanosensitive ion channel family protein [Tenacibaculum finnmarkense genomovar finnmarkense]MCD8446246.1 mechanosensitive ion channel family protein [Tenacibaculum finnmarkense genomovar finnmarkense]MCG8901705.1 mechanosensitive ion channel [Tenacibaculum finnmarkense]WCC44623.1 mechanosensitive ion channel [Tenacibaculum finnmarkense]